MLALLWLPVTITGFWMARHKRFVEHREWMIRSYALTTSIVVNRLWGAVLVLVLLPQLDSTFGREPGRAYRHCRQHQRLAQLDRQPASGRVVAATRSQRPAQSAGGGTTSLR
jgi:Predicted membrane protein (DUF2306)